MSGGGVGGGGWVQWGKGGRLMQKWGVTTILITLQFNYIYSVCGKSKVFFITFFPSGFMQDSHLIQVFIVPKYCMPQVGPKWNTYLSFYQAKFENKF